MVNTKGRPKAKESIVEPAKGLPEASNEVSLEKKRLIKPDRADKELTEEDIARIMALAMEQIEGHLRYCSRWKLKATVARDKIQGTLQEVVNSLRSWRVLETLYRPSEEVPTVEPRERVGRRTLGDSRGVSVDSKGTLEG